MSSLEVVTFPVVVASSRQRFNLGKNKSRIGEFTFRGKLELARSKVDNSSPDAQTHHYFKVSKIQDAQRRVSLLQQENNSLCVRLANIYRGSGMVDCWNEYQKKSVFRQKQNIERVRITLENQAILKRLRDRKPTYDRKQYEKEWQAKFQELCEKHFSFSSIKSRPPQVPPNDTQSYILAPGRSSDVIKDLSQCLEVMRVWMKNPESKLDNMKNSKPLRSTRNTTSS